MSGDDAVLRAESRGRSARRVGSPWILGALLLLAVVVCIVSLGGGAGSLSPATVYDVLHSRVGGPAVTRSELAIVWDIRTPRILLGLIVGAGLAISGVLVQTLVRNALADPHLLGVSSGAAVGATTVITTGFLAGLGLWAISAGAMVGALGAALLVFFITMSQGGITPLRLVLTGTVLASALSAIASFMVLRTNDSQAAQSVLFWLLGSLAGATWEKLVPPVLIVTLCALVAFALHGWLDALAAGPDVAGAVGVAVPMLRNLLFVMLSVMVGTMVAVSGAIAFVGLVIPHIARLLVGSRHRWVLPVAAVLGAVFLVLVDLVARTALRPVEIPLSVVTGVIGAPLFLLILGRRHYQFGSAA